MPRDDRAEQSVMLRDIATDVKALRDSASRHDESLRGIWREIREDIKPGIKELGREQRELFAAHEEKCPALQAFMIKATTVVTPHPAHAQNNTEIGTFPKTLLYWFAGIGVSAAAAFVVLKKLGIW